MGESFSNFICFIYTRIIIFLNYFFEIIHILTGFAIFKFSYEDFEKSLSDEAKEFLMENEYARLLFKNAFLDCHKNYSTLGRFGLKKDSIKCLERLAEMRNVIKNEPEIKSIPISKPVFILTLPRTGSTFLHCLLSKDKRWKSPAKWEMGKPYPYPMDPPSKINEETIETFRKTGVYLNYIYGIKNMRSSHLLKPTDGEDIATYFRGEGIFCSHMQTVNYLNYREFFKKLSYNTWLKIYDNFKDRLRMIARYQNLENRRLLIVTHLGLGCNVFALLETFPDAQFIILHRDPVKIVPSMTSLYQYTSNVHRKPFTNITQRVCDTVTDEYLEEIDKMFIWRKDKRFSEKRIVDVHFSNLVNDPKSVIRKIYKFLDVEYNKECDLVFEEYIKFQNNHKYGVHKYLKMSVDKAKIRRRSKEYMIKYKVKPDI